MHITAYPCPLPGGAAGSEFALALDRDRQHRLLVLPSVAAAMDQALANGLGHADYAVFTKAT